MLVSVTGFLSISLPDLVLGGSVWERLAVWLDPQTGHCYESDTPALLFLFINLFDFHQPLARLQVIEKRD